MTLVEDRAGDLERENAELRHRLAEREAELAEALEQQAATAEVLQVINSSLGDLKPVFDAILDRAHTLCGVEYGVLLTYDGELFWPVAMHGAPPGFRERRGGFRPSSGFTGLVRGERLLHIQDMAQFAEQRPDEPIYRQLLENGGIRTQLAVPLRKDGRLLGIITANRREVRPFSEKQIALLENFAAQAVIAMENARLITETREALEQQTATAEVLQVINSSPGDLAPVFDAILEKAHNLCGADHGSLFLQDGEVFRAIASRGMSDAMTGRLRDGIRPSDSPLTRPLMAGEPFVHLHDSSLEEHPNWIHRAMDVVSSHRTLLSIPLRKSGALLGTIVAGRFEVRPFTDTQIALLQNFAAQAVIAMENARLLTETREALEQQTATAEVLQVINSSPGDLGPVFDAMLEKATTLCDAAFGIMSTWDGECFHRVAFRGASPELIEALRQPNSPIPGSMAAEKLLRGMTTVCAADIREQGAYQAGAPVVRALVDIGGARSHAMVGLYKDGVLLGAITVYRREIRPFTDKQIALLQNFAAQAVIAMENARLLTETREALEQQTATAEVLQVINSSPGDLTPVFDALLEKATTLCDAALGIMLTWDGQCFHRVAFRGASAELIAALRQPNRPVPGSMAEQIVNGARMIRAADIREEPAYGVPGAPVNPVVEIGGARSHVAVTLRKDDALLGLFSIYRQEVRPFTDKQIALLQNFGAQAVIAMENARLITETREALEQQTATAEVLQVINSSPGDLTPVFDAMLERALRFCDGAYGSLFTFDGERFSATATRGETGYNDWLRQSGPFLPPPGGLLDRALRGEDIVEVVDLLEHDEIRQYPALQRMVELGGYRSLLNVALRKENTFFGVITINRKEKRPFTDKQIALLQNFAAQAVIAMENARLLGELRQRTDEVAELNRGLEARVAEQVEELGRVGRLKRFLAPQLAELIVSQGDEQILESHRREIVVVFCDLRGYTAFTETAEPEEVLDFLREYHGALGPLVAQFEGTLDQFSGDGIMVFFNDPVPCPDPAERAVKMAMAMREAAGKLITDWRRHSYELGFGAGIAQGYATLGQIGFSDRSGYTAIGTVCNLAARLCAEAKDGQILVSSRIAETVEAVATLEDLGNLELKGLRRPVAAFNVTELTHGV